MLKEVRFQYCHEGCWLQDTTAELPGLTLVATSIYLSGDDVVIGFTAHGEPEVVEAAHAAWKANDRIGKVTRVHEGPRGTRFHVAYDKTGSIYPDIIEHTPVSIGSIRFSAGQEFYHIIGEGPDISGLLRTLGQHGELKVQSVREVDDLDAPTEDGLPSLTDKQVEALLAAHKAGYYEWPRRQTASQLAQGLGLSSSAFLDHLRTAEARIIGSQVESLLAREPERRFAGTTSKRPATSASDRP